MKTLLRSLAVLAAALITVSAARAAAEWTEDYASAAAQARKQHKMILLDFTGSDWCIWCQRTDKEVFQTPEFQKYAKKNLVLVKVDFPQAHPLPDVVKAQNAKLQEKFGITAFPTLVVLNSNEKVLFAQLGYKEGGPQAFIAQFPAKDK